MAGAETMAGRQWAQTALAGVAGKGQRKDRQALWTSVRLTEGLGPPGRIGSGHGDAGRSPSFMRGFGTSVALLPPPTLSWAYTRASRSASLSPHPFVLPFVLRLTAPAGVERLFPLVSRCCSHLCRVRSLWKSPRPPFSLRVDSCLARPAVAHIPFFVRTSPSSPARPRASCATPPRVPTP